MRRIHSLRASILAAGLLVAAAAAQQDDSAKIRLTGYTSLEFGQVVKGVNRSGPVSKRWTEGFCLALGADARVNDRLRVHAMAESFGTFSFDVSQKLIDMYRDTQYPRFSVQPARADGEYRVCGRPESPLLEIQLGYFPYKYSPQVRNLGEFLFRSGTYPQYLMSQFDVPFARLLGLRLGSTIPLSGRTGVRQDLMLTSEVNRWPLMDFSLSYLAFLSAGSVIDIGGGVCFSGLIPVDPAITAPYNGGLNQLPDSSGNYTFAGTKIVARFTFDPKGFFKAAFLGAEDLKLYAEMAILGVKDYPVFYEHIGRRMPLALGFNFPGFRLLDVLALEAEYWDNPYPNSYLRVYADAVPQPYTDNLGVNYAHDRWKWSVHAEKTVVKGFSLIGQIAKDHIQPLTHSVVLQDKTDVLQTREHWWWVLKAKFVF